MSSYIHPSSLVDPSVFIGKNVKIGPFCVIEKDVNLLDNVELKSHVVISSRVTIGEGTVIYPFAAIGSAPQDLKYRGEASEVIIGKHNVIREHVTISPGTATGKMKTKLGDHCLIMIGAHIAHDCEVGNNVIMANNATLGGHVIVEDYAILGGLVAVHQFVRIGQYSMIGGTSGVKYDVPPFAMIMAQEPRTAGINLIGLKRHEFSKADIVALKESYYILFNKQHSFSKAASILREKFPNNLRVNQLINFTSTEAIRGIRKSELNFDNESGRS